MTIKELKHKYGLRQVSGSTVDEWENARTGLHVEPCPVGFVVRRFLPHRGFTGKAKIVSTIAQADKALNKMSQMPVVPSYVYTMDAARKRLDRGETRVLVFLPNDGRLMPVTKTNWTQATKIFNMCRKGGFA